MEPQAQSVDILPAREHGSRGDDRKDEVAATEMVLSPAKTL